MADVKAPASLAANYTSAAVASPETLQRLLTQHASTTDTLGAQIAANVYAGAKVLPAVPFVGGKPQYVSHGLGRVPVGYHCCRAKGSPWSPVELALESGHDPKLEVRLVTTGSGTYDLVFH